MADRFPLPGPRDVFASLDTADATRVVVACPPHPEMGGDRRDSRLRAVSDALGASDCACLRFDYGPWDEGRAEQTDVRNALAWAHDNFERVGLFGYSFGGGVALLASAAAFRENDSTVPAAVSLLSPVGTLAGEPTAPAVDALDCPLQVLYGERDSTVDSVGIADRAREHGHSVDALPADHFFVGQTDDVADRVAAFFDGALRG
jgi:alpha/beta superfamily hydrolase